MSNSLASKSFSNPDVLKEPEKTHSASVNLGVATATKLVLQPGWKWSECVKPLVGGHSCQAAHVGVVIQGSMTVAHDDGSEITVNAGDAYTFAPGHDGWVNGDVEFIGYEVTVATKNFGAWSSPKS
ncbi:MAG: cupin domain-containing protein [Rhodobacterales bacterium]|jgi:hypothetical protein|tara:strand:+ start:69 stop:446 length:378 start_codon:yes stop_codon:yes gene_type:complete